MNLIRRNNQKSGTKSNLVYNKDFTFYKYSNIKEFVKRSFYSKLNNLITFKGILELFYDDTKDIKLDNEDQENNLGKRKL